MINPGLRIGRYEVRDQLGRGGFGVVHLARDVELGRDVALKVLKAEYLTKPQVVQRFLKEARAAATIGHPGIVTVFECGQISGTGTRADGNAYIAMELLRGQSLTDRISDRGRLGLTPTLAICRQLAGALAAAHAAGIIHRDLKPDNVFLIPDAAVHGGERVKILDFGVAKLNDLSETVILAEPERAESRTESTFENTHSKLMLGTPLYMSPEQARSAGKIDHRSDIYSLGCILYELACGRVPYSGDIREVLTKHRDAPPTRPISIADMPKSLDALIVRMLAKAPDERPATMSEVETALATCERDHQRDQALENAPTIADGGIVPRPPDDDDDDETTDLPQVDEVTTKLTREQLLLTLRGQHAPPPVPKAPPAGPPVRPTPMPGPPVRPTPMPVPQNQRPASAPTPPTDPRQKTFDEANTHPVPRTAGTSLVTTTPVPRVVSPELPTLPVTRVVSTEVVPPPERPLAWHSPRVLALAIGGLALGGLLTFLLLRRDAPATRTESEKVTEAVADAAAAPPSPPPDAAVVVTTSVDAAPAEPDVARLRGECKVMILEKRFQAAIDCAMKLVELGDPEGTMLRARATSEANAEESLGNLNERLAANDLDGAKRALDGIDASSLFRKTASESYERAFQKALSSQTGRAQAAVARGGCAELARVLGALGDGQRVVEAEVRKRVKCVDNPSESRKDKGSAGPCDSKALDREGEEHLSRGSWTAAISAYERALGCEPTEMRAARAFMASCNAREATKAKRFYKLLSAGSQAKYAQICVRNGITP